MAVSNQTLKAVFALQDNYTLAIRTILQSQEDYETRQRRIDEATRVFQNRLNNMQGSSDKAAGGIGRLAARVGTLVSVTVLAKKAWDEMWKAVNTSSMQLMQETTFGALVGNKAAGSAVYDWVSEYAKTSALGREDLAKGMINFLTYSRDAGELQRMIKMTERLYAKDPTQGAEGAVFALKEILSGDMMSMRNRYNITGFNGASIRKKMTAGDTTAALDEIDAVLTRFGASQEVVDANFHNMTVQASMFSSNLKTAIGEEATPVMEEMAVMWARLNDEFAAGKFQPFINAAVGGFRMIGTMVIWAADNANVLIPAIGGVTSALIAYNTVKTVTVMLETAGAAVTWAAIMPYVALAAAVLGVAAAFGIANGGMDRFVSRVGTVASLDKRFKDMSGALNDTVPVEITNSSPISVKGEVQIEEESMKWAMDLAGVRYFASFSHVVPQVVMQGVQISEKVDLDDVLDGMTERMIKLSASQPAGLPAMG